MSKQAQLADGTILEFPDDTPDAVMDKAVRAHLSGQSAPQAAPAAPAESPWYGSADDWKRAAGSTARDVMEGAAGVAGIVTDPFVALSNKMLGRQDLSAVGAMSSALDSAGLPHAPEGAGQVASAINRGVAAGGGFMGLGRGLMGAAAPAVQGVGRTLAANPGSQLAGSVLGAGAGETTRQMGGGPTAQTLAALTGALAPAGASATMRGAVRGTDPDDMRRTIDSFRDAGVGVPTVGQASQGRLPRGLEALLSRTPGGAGIFANKADDQAAGMGKRVEEIAGSLAPRASAKQAGAAIVSGIKGEGGFVEQFKTKQRELFDALDRHIFPSQRIDVSNTRAALGSLNAPIPGAPNTSKLFQNSRIAGIGNALESDVAITTAEQKALADALENIDALYASRNAATQTSGQLRALANQQANRTHNFYPVPGQPRIPGRYSPFPERSAQATTAADEAQAIARNKAAEARGLEQTVADLQAAAQASGGKLPYEAIKKLRTLVGQEMADAGLVSDVPRSKWKALYSALSKDLEAAAAEAGPEASAVFSRANNYTKAGMGRLEVLDSVIQKKGGPEKVFAAAMSGTREGATTLRAVMRSLPPDAQKQLTATVIRRLGRANPSAQNDLGEKFSTETFLTNWNSMAPEARSALFDRFGPRYVHSMTKISRLADVSKAASNMREGSAVFRNPPGTAAASNQAYTVGGFVLSALTGNYGTAAGIAGGVLSANIASRAMTNPRFVEWLAKQTTVPASAMGGSLTALRNEARATKDADLAEIAEALQERANQ